MCISCMDSDKWNEIGKALLIAMVIGLTYAIVVWVYITFT